MPLDRTFVSHRCTQRSLQNLPTELLLQIAFGCGYEALRSLSLVSRLLRGVGQEALFQHIKLSNRPREENSQVRSLFYAVRGNRTLGEAVKTLTMYPVNKLISFEQDGKPFRIIESRLAGWLLRGLPNLRALSIGVYEGFTNFSGTSQLYITSRFETNIMRCLFGGDPTVENLSTIAGLSKLERLEILRGSLASIAPLTRLPKFRELILGPRTRELMVLNPLSTQHAQSTFTSPALVLDSINDLNDYNLLLLLRRFVSLRSLRIRLHYEVLLNTLLTNISERLQPVASTLEEIHLEGPQQTFHESRWVSPLNFRLGFLVEVTLVEIPHSLLMADAGLANNNGYWPLTAELLPPKIEELIIKYPSSNIFAWFQNIRNWNLMYPRLREIDLLCSSGGEEPYYSIYPLAMESQARETLHRQGIELSVTKV